MAVTKVGHVALTVTDLEEAIGHYVGNVGLIPTRSVDGTAYLRAPADQDSYCLVLQESDSAQLARIGLKLSAVGDLEELESAATSAGATVQRLSRGEEHDLGEAVVFGLPSGQEIWAYHEIGNIGFLEGMRNPDPVASDRTIGTMRATRLDHIGIGAPDTGDVHKFLTEVLDFQSVELLIGEDGRPVGAWMSCGGTLHDIAITPGASASFHHAAFSAESQGALINGVDILRHRDIPTFDYGLSRHGIGGVNTTYFHDPSGHRNELFADPYVTVGTPGKVPAVEWQMEDFGRAAFYFENELDMAFMSEAT